MSSSPPQLAILLPFFNRFDQVNACITALQPQLPINATLVLVDDGSSPAYSAGLCPNQVILRHSNNRGVAAARNTALRWCRDNQIDLVLMIDSDCRPAADFVEKHIELHNQYQDAACIGGGIIGQGQGLWANIDRLISWVHSVPAGSVHQVEHPYHLPTTNFSAKLKHLPQRQAVFDERLRTGEDALLIRELRGAGKQVLFSPTPIIYHQDRESLRALLAHQFEWGHHQYFVQLGSDLSERCFSPLYRVVFLLCFTPLLPLFALAGSTLNILPWLKRGEPALPYFPWFYFIWLIKGVAVIDSALRPYQVLRSPGVD